MLEQQEYLGTYIGGYQLIAQLFASSSSYTFLGETASLTDRQRVVIKWYYAVHLTTQQEKKAFLYKASMLKRLQQPFILPILATGLFVDTPYIVIPYMNKGSLDDRIHNPADQAWLQEHAGIIIKQIGQALAYSHKQNVAHGNLHPGNILFNERDEVQLTDFQLIPIGTANIPTNIKAGQKLDSHPELAAKDSDHYALGNIAHKLLIGCNSSTNQTPNALCDSQDNTPLTADAESHFTPVPDIEEASTPKPLQQLSDTSEISTSQSTLDIPTERLSSIVVPTAETLPVAAAEPSSTSATEPSIQNGTPSIVSCIDVHTSIETPTLPPTPLPAKTSTNKGTIKNSLPLLTSSQPNGMRVDSIRGLLRDPGSLFLLSGILCIIIFSILGTQFATEPHTHSLEEQRAHLLDSTTVDLSTPQPTSSEIKSTSRLIHQTTPIDIFPDTTTPVTVQHTQSIHGSTGRLSPTPSQDQFMPLTVSPSYLNPQTCKIIGAYYTCTVTLALGSHQRDQSWYSFSNTTAALVSPISGFMRPGSHVPITIRIALNCYGYGTITFIGNNTKTSLTLNC